jgi:hypothetical protein
MHPYSSRIFQGYQECHKKHCGLGELNMTNKQLSFIDQFKNKTEIARYIFFGC